MCQGCVYESDDPKLERQVNLGIAGATAGMLVFMIGTFVGINSLVPNIADQGAGQNRIEAVRPGSPAPTAPSATLLVR
jgi:hypothetical protein